MKEVAWQPRHRRKEQQEADVKSRHGPDRPERPVKGGFLKRVRERPAKEGFFKRFRPSGKGR